MVLAFFYWQPFFFGITCKGRKQLYNEVRREFLSIMEKGGYGQLHSHPHSEHLLLVVKGELIVRNSKESHRLPVDSAILIYPGEEHEIINSFDGTSEYWVVYSPPR